jgi:hypothetical protein
MLAIMPRAAGLCLLFVMSACGEEPRSLPTAPTVPTAPSTPVAPTFTLSGVITERFSGRPVQKANVWVHPFTLAQVRSWPPGGMRMTPSDRDGRYTISGLPSLGPVWVVAWPELWDPFSAPYVHQCVTTVTVEGDATLDVTVSSTTDLVALNASTGPTPPNSRIVSGTVFEITSNGRQPVSNVWVGWAAVSGLDDSFMAETRTDAAGHYRLCGLPRERITLSAWSLPLAPASAYPNVFYASVDPGSDAVVDIEIARK